MKLIVGLGNPGPKYLMTRHNIGFLLVDALNEQFSDGQYKSQGKALVNKARFGSEIVLLAKPQTFMNLSGDSTRSLLDYYSVSLDDLLVIHDEVDLPFGRMKLQKARGHGGHNGIRDIHLKVASNQYARLRLGVSRPSNPRQDVADYVLQPFSKEEQNGLADFLSIAGEAVESFILDGFDVAANKFNKKAEL